MNEHLEWVPLGQIRLHPRARSHNPVKFEELKESMRTQGQLQPCLGRHFSRHSEEATATEESQHRDSLPSAQNDELIEVYIGQGRYLAAKSMNWECIQIMISERTDEEVDIAMLHENLKREDLDPITEAKEYAYLLKTHGWTQGQLADKMGKSQQAISDSLALLDVSPDVQEFTARAVISKRHALLIQKISDQSLQSEFAKAVVEGGISVKQTEEMINLYKTSGQEALGMVLNLARLKDQNLISNDHENGQSTDASSAIVSPREETKRSQPGRNISKFWPGLPEGVTFKSEGGRLHLFWYKSKYPDIKSLMKELVKTAPDSVTQSETQESNPPQEPMEVTTTPN